MGREREREREMGVISFWRAEMRWIKHDVICIRMLGSIETKYNKTSAYIIRDIIINSAQTTVSLCPCLCLSLRREREKEKGREIQREREREIERERERERERE